VVVTRAAVLDGLDAAGYTPHGLHSQDGIWVEKNCYVDLWIELLHALKLEPRACLGFTLAVDFEGDQWTFFKPSHDELRSLYGVDVQELTVWRPLIDHAVEHLGAGKWISTEADAFWLPDTAGTDYRHQHTKTTIVLNDIDVEARRLGYFHNAGYFTLEAEDFIKAFRLDVTGDDPAFLPLFAELIRLDRVVAKPAHELKGDARLLLRKHVERRGRPHPVARFEERFIRDLPQLQGAGLAAYHRWAFAGIRQLGAAAELASQHLQWLDEPAFAPAVGALRELAGDCKTLILKAARSVNSRRALDASATFANMAVAWDVAMSCVAAHA
jgi:hypothetical protein